MASRSCDSGHRFHSNQFAGFLSGFGSRYDGVGGVVTSLIDWLQAVRRYPPWSRSWPARQVDPEDSSCGQLDLGPAEMSMPFIDGLTIGLA